MLSTGKPYAIAHSAGNANGKLSTLCAVTSGKPFVKRLQRSRELRTLIREAGAFIARDAIFRSHAPLKT